MRTIKAICTVTFLMLALSLPAFAGDISTPGIAGTGPTIEDPEKDKPTTAPGEINTPGLMDFLVSLISTF